VTTTALDHIRETLRLVAAQLVDDGAAVRVDASQQSDHLLLEVHCAGEDVGKLIGKAGQTISAIRVLVTAMCTKHESKVVVEVIEPEVGD